MCLKMLMSLIRSEQINNLGRTNSNSFITTMNYDHELFNGSSLLLHNSNISRNLVLTWSVVTSNDVPTFICTMSFDESMLYFLAHMLAKSVEKHRKIKALYFHLEITKFLTLEHDLIARRNNQQRKFLEKFN